MKKIAGVLILISLFASNLQAQYDNKAKDILDKMSKRYREMSSFKAGFTYVVNSPVSGMKDSSKGKIAVEGRKYRIQFPNKEMITNGKTSWMYMKEANEVNITNYEPSDKEVTPVNFHKLYKKGYKYNLLRNKQINGDKHAIIDLVPEDKQQQVFKVRLTVNVSDYSIKSWKMFEKNGNRYTISINNIQNGVDFPDDHFRFDKSAHKGVEVVDLR